MQQVAFALFNGLASGMAIFLVAAGVTLIFGILKIVNFSHGAFFMLGAYLAFTMTGASVSSIWMLLGLGLLTGIILGIMGYVVDVVVLRRIGKFDEHFVLIGTFAVMLMVVGGIKLIWGLDYHFVAPPQSLAGALRIGNVVLPTYSLFVIIAGIVAFVALDLCLHKMWIGKLLRSVVSDKWMMSVLGYDVTALYTLTVIMAFALTGVAGALLLPNQSLSPLLGDHYLLLGFVCCIIGGLGNVRGAFIAAIGLGVIENFSAIMLHFKPGMVVYVSMVAVLLLRPQGLFISLSSAAPVPSEGLFERLLRPVKRLSLARVPDHADQRVERPQSERVYVLGTVCTVLIVALATTPLWATPDVTFLAGLTAINALFALCWFFLFHYAGVVSFGHAAFFALGAYGTGYILKTYTWMPFLAVLGVVVLAGAALAAVVGVIALRRASGIYLAILTMALAEIFHLVVTSSTALGRDDGLPAIPRPTLDLGIAELPLTGNAAYFYFILVACTLGGAVLWRCAHGPFGRTLQAIRQDRMRAAFIGIPYMGYLRRAFVISGGMAAFAGGLYAPWTQIVTPEVTGLMNSVQPMLNTLLGGTVSFFGPVLGSSFFAAIEYYTRTMPGAAEVLVGTILLIVVLVSPEGIAGLLNSAERMARRSGSLFGQNSQNASMSRKDE